MPCCSSQVRLKATGLHIVFLQSSEPVAGGWGERGPSSWCQTKYLCFYLSASLEFWVTCHRNKGPCCKKMVWKPLL